MNDTLFNDLPITKSPRLLWMERHNITTENHGVDADGNTWTAFNAFNRDGRPYFTMQSGKTEDEALTALAMAANIRLWNEA